VLLLDYLCSLLKISSPMITVTTEQESQAGFTLSLKNGGWVYMKQRCSACLLLPMTQLLTFQPADTRRDIT